MKFHSNNRFSTENFTLYYLKYKLFGYIDPSPDSSKKNIKWILQDPFHLPIHHDNMKWLLIAPPKKPKNCIHTTYIEKQNVPQLIF
jgi:hypothetical protein